MKPVFVWPIFTSAIDHGLTLRNGRVQEGFKWVIENMVDLVRRRVQVIEKRRIVEECYHRSDPEAIEGYERMQTTKGVNVRRGERQPDLFTRFSVLVQVSVGTQTDKTSILTAVYVQPESEGSIRPPGNAV
jgi:hypothetical protein